MPIARARMATTLARRCRESNAILRSTPKVCPMLWLLQQPRSWIAKGHCLRCAAVRRIYKLFKVFWLTADMSANRLHMLLKNCLAPRFKSPNAVSCTPLPSCLSAGWLSDHSPGSKNAAVCGKTANESSTPAYSSFTSPSSRFCSEDREQVLIKTID